MAAGLLAGKRGLIMGVANERSSAWGIADRFRQRTQPLAEPLHLIGEGKLGAGLGGGGGDAPGAGAFICDAHDQAPLAGKKSRRHVRPF